MRIAKFTALPVVAILVASAAACGSSSTTSSSNTTSTVPKVVSPTFVGKVNGTDAYIGIVTNTSGAVTAYVCDGAGNKVGDFFQDSIPAGANNATLKTTDSSDTLTINASQSQLQNVIATGGSITGAWNEAGGASHGFTVQAAHPPGAFWGERETVNGTPRHGKWVVLNDGSVRGSLDLGTGNDAITLGQSTGVAGADIKVGKSVQTPDTYPPDQTSTAIVMELPKQTTQKSDLVVKTSSSKTVFYLTRESPPPTPPLTPPPTPPPTPAPSTPRTPRPTPPPSTP